MEKPTQEEIPHGEGRWKTEGRRLIYIILFAVIFHIAEIVLSLIVAVQFLSRLITGQSITSLLSLGRRLGAYVSELIVYLTYNTDERPYPFGSWPADPQDEEAPRSGDPSM